MPLGDRTVAEDLPMDESPPLDSVSGGRKRILPPRAAAHRVSYIDEQEKEAAIRESARIRKRRCEAVEEDPNTEELALHRSLTETINTSTNQNGTTEVPTALLRQLMQVVTKQTQQFTQIIQEKDNIIQIITQQLQDSLQQEQNNSKNRHDMLGREIKELKVTVQELRQQIAAPSCPSWAAVAARSTLSPPTSPSVSLSSTIARPEQKPKTATLAIDLTNVDSSTLPTTASASDIKARVTAALSADPQTVNVEVKGIQWGSMGRLVLILASEKQRRIVFEHQEWLNKLAPGAKLAGEQWYPIKCDGVRKAAVVKEDGWTLREDIKEMIEQENTHSADFPICVRKVNWLSKQSDRPAGSLVVYLTSKEAAEELLQRQVIDIGGQATFTKPFIRIPRPDRCYKCCQYGHVQKYCISPAQCGKCAGPHQFKQCTSSTVKCAACQGDHQVTYPKCPEYTRQLEKMQSRLTRSPPSSVN
jgi:hypothetical protein